MVSNSEEKESGIMEIDPPRMKSKFLKMLSYWVRMREPRGGRNGKCNCFRSIFPPVKMSYGQ